MPVDFGGKGIISAKEQYKENMRRDHIKQEKAIKNDCPIIYVLPKYEIEIVISLVEKEIRDRTQSTPQSP